MVLEMLRVLEDIYQKEFNENPIYQHTDTLQEGVKSKQYQPLMSRIRCGKIIFTANTSFKEILIKYSSFIYSELRKPNRPLYKEKKD